MTKQESITCRTFQIEVTMSGSAVVVQRKLHVFPDDEWQHEFLELLRDTTNETKPVLTYTHHVVDEHIIILSLTSTRTGSLNDCMRELFADTVGSIRALAGASEPVLSGQ